MISGMCTVCTFFSVFALLKKNFQLKLNNCATIRLEFTFVFWTMSQMNCVLQITSGLSSKILLSLGDADTMQKVSVGFERLFGCIFIKMGNRPIIKRLYARLKVCLKKKLSDLNIFSKDRSKISSFTIKDEDAGYPFSSRFSIFPGL